MIVLREPEHEYSKMISHIARKVSKNLVGLALGSGAALGFAHIGVLRVLEREKILPADFQISEIPRLSTNGVRRELRAQVMDLQLDVEDQSTIMFSFELQKGNYATTLLREFMKAENLRDY